MTRRSPIGKQRASALRVRARRAEMSSAVKPRDSRIRMTTTTTTTGTSLRAPVPLTATTVRASGATRARGDARHSASASLRRCEVTDYCCLHRRRLRHTLARLGRRCRQVQRRRVWSGNPRVVYTPVVSVVTLARIAK